MSSGKWNILKDLENFSLVTKTNVGFSFWTSLTMVTLTFTPNHSLIILHQTLKLSPPQPWAQNFDFIFFFFSGLSPSKLSSPPIYFHNVGHQLWRWLRNVCLSLISIIGWIFPIGCLVLKSQTHLHPQNKLICCFPGSLKSTSTPLSSTLSKPWREEKETNLNRMPGPCWYFHTLPHLILITGMEVDKIVSIFKWGNIGSEGLKNLPEVRKQSWKQLKKQSLDLNSGVFDSKICALFILHL